MSAKQVAGLLRTASSVVLLIHQKPDGDAIGSAYALADVLKSKRPKIICATVIAPVFTEELGGLTVKTELPLNAGLYVVLDCPDLKRTGFATALAKIGRHKKVLVIDHHQKGDLATVACEYFSRRDVSSTCELVAEIIDELRVPIKPRLATALLLGIHTDTGGLQHPNTTSQTLLLAARLVRLGADYERIRNLFTPRRNLNKLRLWGRVLGSISINSMGIAVAKVTKVTLKETNADEDDLSGLAKYLCSVEGTKAALVLVETENGWRGSLRAGSRAINVGRLAKLLGGNGGRKVAGFLATDELISGTMFQNFRATQPKNTGVEKK